MSRQKLGHAIWQNNGKLDQTLFSLSIGNALNVLSNLSMFVQYLNLYERNYETRNSRFINWNIIVRKNWRIIIILAIN